MTYNHQQSEERVKLDPSEILFKESCEEALGRIVGGLRKDFLDTRYLEKVKRWVCLVMDARNGFETEQDIWRGCPCQDTIAGFLTSSKVKVWEYDYIALDFEQFLPKLKDAIEALIDEIKK